MSLSETWGRCFFGGRARDVLRKLIKEVLPEFRAPMTRTLNGVGSLRLRTCEARSQCMLNVDAELAYSSRADDTADDAGSIAVSAT